MTAYFAPIAWVNGEFQTDVRIELDGQSFASVEVGGSEEGATRLDGVTFPGFANTHSHVFHRLLRGHVGRGDFWSWREAMYEVASVLDPDSYRRIAAATYREMLAAGYTSVTEFHYLHHQLDGTPYDDPNVMKEALSESAIETGIRLRVLDTCYLSAGFGDPVEGVQRRFSDGTVDAWTERVSRWKPPAGVEYGAAIHSIRAVTPREARIVAEWADGRPLHVHLSEQATENEACLDKYGASPTQVLAGAGVLGPNTTVVHATHLNAEDIDLLARSGATASICPTTERWLADGIGPSGALEEAGVPLRVGSDSQAVIDPFEEVSLLELHQRLQTGQVGTHGIVSLIGLGGGAIERGRFADLVTVTTETARTGGVDPEGLIFAATSADVSAVVASGRRLV